MTKQNGNDLLIPSIEDIDMIVFDVDGTLMDRDGMPPGMVGLMKETESRGVTISLASGRTLPNLTMENFVLMVPEEIFSASAKD